MRPAQRAASRVFALRGARHGQVAQQAGVPGAGGDGLLEAMRGVGVTALAQRQHAHQIERRRMSGFDRQRRFQAASGVVVPPPVGEGFRHADEGRHMLRIAPQNALITDQCARQIARRLARGGHGIEQIQRLRRQLQGGLEGCERQRGFAEAKVNLAQVLLQLARRRRDRPCRLVGRPRQDEAARLLMDEAEQTTLGIAPGLLGEQCFETPAGLRFIPARERRPRFALDLRGLHHAIRPLRTRRTKTV